MKSTSLQNFSAALAALVVITSVSGCISIKREVEPTQTTTTTTATSVPTRVVPASTTVQRTTTY